MSFRRIKLAGFWRRYWFLILSVFLIFGAYIVGSHYNVIQNQMINSQAKASVKNKRQMSSDEVALAVKNHTVAKPVYNVTQGHMPVAGGQSPAQILKQAKQPNNEALRGYVSVPSYHIKEPLYEGVSNHVLAIGVGIFEPNSQFGKGYISIFGHNMDDFNTPYPTKFSAMQNMTPSRIIGQDIIISSKGTNYTYRITDFRRGVPIESLNREVARHESSTPEKPMVQLVACDEDAQFQKQLRDSNYTNFTADKRLVLTGVLEREN